MESLYLLVPVALVFLGIAIWVLFWAVNSGQYDDLKTEGYRILFDEEKKATEGEDRQQDGVNTAGDADASKDRQQE